MAYDDDVREMAEDFKKRIEEHEFETREQFIDRFNEEIDGCGRVIYTAQAKECVCESSNDSAAIDEMGAGAIDWSKGIPWSVLAYFAYQADILEALRRLDVDVNDDATFTPEEKEDEEDDEDEDDENE